MYCVKTNVKDLLPGWPLWGLAWSCNGSENTGQDRCVCLYVQAHILMSVIRSITYCLERKSQEISWKWIEKQYLMETSTTTPGVKMCHKLTRDHVWLTSFTRMRVYLAAQVSLIIESSGILHCIVCGLVHENSSIYLCILPSSNLGDE